MNDTATAPQPPLAARGNAAYTGGTALAERPQMFNLAPQNFEQALILADYMADSGMVPKDFLGKPGNCLIAIQWGAELGLQPMQAVQNIAVINGRPSLWGDVMLALVRSSPLCEYVVETIEGERAICKVKRRGEPEQTREFTKADAEKAQLWGKQGPWQNYPKRMMQMRARAWALRDVFTDLLRGLHMAEEAVDLPPLKDMGPVQYAEGSTAGSATPPPPPPPPPPAAEKEKKLPAISEKDFAEKLPVWRGMVASGQKPIDRMVAFVKSKYTITEAQEQAIRRNPYDKGSATDVDPKGTPPVAITYAQLVDKMNEAAKAKDRDALDQAATLINTLPDDQQRAEATQHYEALLEEF